MNKTNKTISHWSLSSREVNGSTKALSIKCEAGHLNGLLFETRAAGKRGNLGKCSPGNKLESLTPAEARPPTLLGGDVFLQLGEAL